MVHYLKSKGWLVAWPMRVTHFRSPECFRLCFSPSRKRFYLQSSLSLYLSAISPLWILQSIRRILCILRVWICFRILFLFLKLSLSSAIPSSSFKIYWNTFLSMTAFCRFTCVHSSCHHFLGLDKWFCQFSAQTAMFCYFLRLGCSVEMSPISNLFLSAAHIRVYSRLQGF